MEQITVPFEKKARARELKAYFSKQDRQWYIPEDADEETAAALRNLVFESQKNDIESPANEENNNTQSSTQNSIPDFNLSNENWQSVIESRDTLKTAIAIRDWGMPNDEKQREELLKCLSLRRPTDFPVSYDGMLRCAGIFAQLYPKERVTELAVNYLPGEKYYMDEIRDANISGEEKALLMFAVPIN